MHANLFPGTPAWKALTLFGEVKMILSHVATLIDALQTSCFSCLAFFQMMTRQKTFAPTLIRDFRVVNVLSLWDGGHFFGDNCPCNG